MSKWLIEGGVLEVMRHAPQPTAEQELAHAKEMTSLNADGPRVLTLSGNNAQIDIQGSLTKNPSWMARFFGGGNTTYSEIISALAVAEKDPDITSITLAVDSPGGTLDGLFDTMAALQSAKKPITSVVTGMAASAAYGIVSQTDQIVASSKASQFGSIGVAASFYTSESIVTVTSSNAPNKIPDVKTKEGKAVVRKELDGLEDLFIGDIAAGRGISPKTVTADFGQGAVLLAKEAKQQGMIDSIASAQPTTKPASRVATKMDITELKAKHPEVYTAAVADGETLERKRVKAHLMLGEASGDMATATAAIKDGTSSQDELVQARYATANMKKTAAANVAADDKEAGNAADGAKTTPTAEKSQSDQVRVAFDAIHNKEGVI